jgi:60 kDa SS-A/Ro ribonucleoprotein
MASNYAKHVSAKHTPQTEAIPGTNQVQNNAGGFAFPVTIWTQLDRFLILGSEGNTLYCTERKMTKDNAACVAKCALEDGKRTVDRIVEVSTKGLAAKNDPAIFALALVASLKSPVPGTVLFGREDEAIIATRRLALDAVNQVCRIGTHVFAFTAACNEMRGWGPALRRSVASWYQEKSEKGDLALQLVKYQQREGWGHKDLLRLSHPVGMNSADVRWALGADAKKRTVERKRKVEGKLQDVRTDSYKKVKDELSPIIAAFEEAKTADKKALCKLIRKHELPRECVPTPMLNEPEVWEALLERMPLHAMVRNLATMTRVGLLAPMSEAVGHVLKELGDGERIKRSRLHPVAVLAALLTYKAGRGVRGQNTWSPVGQVVDALDSAFYLAFANVEPTGKRWLIALDVSGSMASGEVAGVPGLTPRVGSCALAMVTMATEKQHHLVAFTSGGGGWNNGGRSRFFGMSSMFGGTPITTDGLTPLTFSPKQRLDDVCAQTAALPMGGTDCALPMIYAKANKVPADVFVVLTDSETWHNPNLHPCQALQEYRQSMGIPAKLIVIGMTSTGFSIADPNDVNQLDVVGFSTDVPQVMGNFIRG